MQALAGYRWRQLLSVLIFLCWCWSLALPVVNTSIDVGGWMKGYAVLIFGWFGIAMFQFGWLANPLFIVMISVLMSSRQPHRRTYAIGGILLLLLAANALFWNDWPDDTGSKAIVAYGSGYFLWVGAIVATALASFVAAVIEKEAA